MDVGFDFGGNIHKEAIGLYTHRGDGIGHVAGMVGLGNMEHVHAVLLQPLGKLHSVGLINAALAALRRHDAELVVDDHIGHGLAQGAHDHAGKAGAVFQAAAELIGAVVHAGAAQAADQAVAVNLNDIQTGLLRADSTGAHFVDDLQQHFLTDFVGEEHHIVVQTLTHLVHFALHEQGVDRIYVIFRVENLHAQLGAVGVDAVSQGLEGGNLAVIKQLGRGGEAVDGGNVAQHDVAYAALSQTGVKAHILVGNHAFVLITGGQWGKHDAVFEGAAAHFNGLQKNVFHGKILRLYVVFYEFCKRVIQCLPRGDGGKIVPAAL